MPIRDEMPVLARHEGEWEGEYIHVDPAGVVLDRHASHLRCALPSEGRWPYYQTNTYIWADGREERIEFPASYHDGQIHFDTDRIAGHAWEVDERTIILTWHYKQQPDDYLYEMIQISDDGIHRSRTWHWFEDGELVKRTLIKEHRIG